jgi:hypothetical protein
MLNLEHDMTDIINVDNDGFNPPENSYPEHVEGAVGYLWDSQEKKWIPLWEQQTT